MVAIDYNDDPYTVVGVGKASELLDFDDSGIAADEMDSDEDAIAIIGKGGYAVYSYMPDGAVVYESSVNEARGLSKKEVRDLKVKINNASTIGKFFTKDEVEFLQSLFESTINEAKKFYNTKEIVKISKLAGDIVLDSKDDIQDLAVIFGDKVPFNELEKVLTNYDLDFEDVNEARSQIKRKYGQYQAINVYEKASIRNNVLKFHRLTS